MNIVGLCVTQGHWSSLRDTSLFWCHHIRESTSMDSYVRSVDDVDIHLLHSGNREILLAKYYRRSSVL